MRITLKPEQERIVRQQLSAGRYHSVDEVLDTALSALPVSDEKRDAKSAREQAGQRIRELRRGLTLGVSKVRDLKHEGHHY